MEKSMGEKLKDARIGMGYTLRKVQELTDVNHSYLHKLETGANKSPGSEALFRLCKLYGIDMTELLNSVVEGK